VANPTVFMIALSSLPTSSIQNFMPVPPEPVTDAQTLPANADAAPHRLLSSARG
jgi:hypothetical protein